MSRAALWTAAALCLASCSLLVPIDHDLTSGSPNAGATGGADAAPDVDVDVAADAHADADGVVTPLDGGPTPTDAGSPELDAEAGSPPPVVDAGACGMGGDPSLVAYFRFDEGSGAVATDCSGSGHDGQVLGPPGWTAGRIGGGLSFNGESSCVDLGPVGSLALGIGPITVTAWVNVTAFPPTSSGRYVFAETASSNVKGWRLAADDGARFDTSLAQDSGVSASVTTAKSLPTGAWLHVATTISTEAALRIYLNGQLVQTKVANPILVDVATHSTIGCKVGGSYFSGILDELRVYRRVLSDAEIAALAR